MRGEEIERPTRGGGCVAMSPMDDSPKSYSDPKVTRWDDARV